MVAYLTTHNLYLFCQKWSDQTLEHSTFHHKFITIDELTFDRCWNGLFLDPCFSSYMFQTFLKQNRAHSKWLNHFFNCTYSNTRYLPTLLNTLPTTAFASSSTYGSIMISFFLNSYNCHNLCDLPAFNYPLNGSWKEIKNQ